MTTAHRVTAIQSQKVVCCGASVCRRFLAVVRVCTRSYRLGTFRYIQSRQGNAAFKISLNLTLIKS